MTLYELLKTVKPTTNLKFNIVSFGLRHWNMTFSTFTIHADKISDDICNMYLKVIQVEEIHPNIDYETNMPYIDVLVSAELINYLKPLITRLNYEYERIYDHVTYKN